MAYPPTPPPNTRTNATPLPENMPSDINAISNALTDIINELGSNPSGADGDVTARLAVIAPPGIITAYAGSTAPTGWALCDGAAISRTTFASLFSAVGTNFGVGDGATTFNLPNLQSRFPVGRGAAGWSDALGESGGSANAVAVAHTHTSADHSHTSTDHSHTFTSGGQSQGHVHSGNELGFLFRDSAYNTGQSTVIPPGGPFAASWQQNTQGNSVDHTHSGTTAGASTGNTTGGASTGNTTGSQSPTAADTNANLPPYLTVNYIIRLV